MRLVLNKQLQFISPVGTVIWRSVVLHPSNGCEGEQHEPRYELVLVWKT